METSIFLALTLLTMTAFGEMSLNSTSASSTAPATSTSTAPLNSTSLNSLPTTSSIPQAGTAAGSPQTAGPLNSAPNGAGGTYGYPNNSVDPNTVNPGLPQPTYYGGPYYNFGGGTVSGTTTAPNAAGAPFVTPPSSTNGLTPAIPSATPNP